MLKAIGLAPYQHLSVHGYWNARRAQGVEEPRQHGLAARDARALRLRGVPLLPAARDELRPRRQLQRGGAGRARERRPRQQPRQPGEPHAEPDREAVRRRDPGGRRAGSGRASRASLACDRRAGATSRRRWTTCASTTRSRASSALGRREPLPRRAGALEGREAAGRRGRACAPCGCTPPPGAPPDFCRAARRRFVPGLAARRSCAARSKRARRRPRHARATRSSRGSSAPAEPPDVDRQPLPRHRRRVRTPTAPRCSSARARRGRRAADRDRRGLRRRAQRRRRRARGGRSARVRDGRRAPARRAPCSTTPAARALRALAGGAARGGRRRVRPRLLLRALAARRAARRSSPSRWRSRASSTCPSSIHVRDAGPTPTTSCSTSGAAEGARRRRRRAPLLHRTTSPSRSARSTQRLDVSFSGILTFKRDRGLREVAAALPLERLLVETDAPLLAPEGHRGARNEPARVARRGRGAGGGAGPPRRGGRARRRPRNARRCSGCPTDDARERRRRCSRSR